MTRTPHWERCDDTDCLVCRDRREAFETKAREFVRARKLRRAEEEHRDGSATLGEFTNP